MSLWARLRSSARAVARRARMESEMDAELRFHIEAAAEDLVRGGVPRDEAVRRARIEFGGIEQAKEECREARGLTFLESLAQDLRYGLRMLRKSPGFTAVAVLTLGLGIGATTAIFGVVYSVLLRPLPYAHANQLVLVFENNLREGVKAAGCSYVDFLEMRAKSRAFAEVAGVQRHDLTLTGRGDPAVVNTVVVTPEIFPLLGEKPLAGRTFFSDANKKGIPPEVLLSEGLWRTRFGGDPDVIGSAINLDQRAFTVVGIMPAGFRVPLLGNRQEIWIPLAQDPLFGGWMERRGGHWLRVVGRLRPDVSLAQAQSEMEAVSARLASAFPAENSGWTVRLAPLQQAMVGDVKSALVVLLGAVGFVLLIACVNIANLLLARGTSRAREIAMRQALGAGRSRIIRQMLTESALVGWFGGGLGILLAYEGVRALGALLPPDLPQFNQVQVDVWVLGFAVLLTTGTSLGFGLAPAFLAPGANVQANLKEGGGRSGEGGARARVRRFLAAAEIALAVVLVVAAGLLVRSFTRLTAVRPGFNVEQTLKAEVSLPRYQYSTPQQWKAFSDALLERMQARAELRDAALAVPLPLADGYVNLGFSIAGGPPLPPGTPSTADYVSVSPEYFRVMGIPLLRGRTFTRGDSPEAPRVTIVSQALAEFYFPNQDPLGKQLVFGFPPDSNITWEIVGVVGDVRDVALRQEPLPMMYVPFAQAPFWGAGVVVKSALPPSAVVAAIRQAVRSIDENLPVTDIATMPDVLDSSVAQPRFQVWLLGQFGAAALLLAATGIFGVISYSVSCRKREFGVRVALGATPSSIRKMVLMEGLRLAGIGLGIGIIGALTLGRFLQSQLYGVGANDPLTFLSSGILLLAAALLACYLPARRATRVDPMIALRSE